MKKIFKKLKNSMFVRKVILLEIIFMYEIVKISKKFYLFIWKCYMPVKKKIKKLLIIFLNVIIAISKFLIFCYFKFELYFLRKFAFVIIAFIWSNFGFKHVFYNYMDHYWYNEVIETWVFRFPVFLVEKIIDLYYWSIRTYYDLKYVFFFSLYRLRLILKIIIRELRKNKLLTKARFFLFSFSLLLVFFYNIKWVMFLINIYNIFISRIDYFIKSSRKYFILYLKVRWYCSFIRHGRLFNRVKQRFERITNVYNTIYDISVVISEFAFKSLNIFDFYKFRKDFKQEYYKKKKGVFFANRRYNFIFVKLLKKRKKFYKKVRRVIYIKNLWLYSLNYNIFYFYKLVFFTFNYFHSSLMYVVDIYLIFIINFCI